MTFRKILFWLHLTAGSFAGAIILVMSVTGVLLAYEKQILAWTERQTAHASQHAAGSVEAMLAASQEPVSVTLRAGGGGMTIAGRGQARAPESRARRFFRVVTDWHRWLGASQQGRATARAITGAANLAFLFLVLSGLYLWFPRRWKWQNVRAVLLFRGGLSGRARDFNWHNAAGFWCCIPLFFIVVSGVVISYPWASDLVYRAAGSYPPARGNGKGKGTPARPVRPSAAPDYSGLNALVERAKAVDPEWRTITFTVPASRHEPVIFTIDAGNGGQPQKRLTVEFDRTSGEVVGLERFADMDAGRRARSWMRFVHTGEYYGIAGQTVAALASAGGALLVWTGLSLAWRRFRNAIRPRP